MLTTVRNVILMSSNIKFFLKIYFKSHCNTAHFQESFLWCISENFFLILQNVCNFAKIGQRWRMWPLKIKTYKKWHDVYNVTWMSNLVTISVVKRHWNYHNEFSFHERNMGDNFITHFLYSSDFEFLIIANKI